MEVTSVDSSDVYRSYDLQWNDFEDGVQYYSAVCRLCRDEKLERF